MNDGTRANLLQKQFSARCAVQLHTERMSRIELRLRIVDVLAVCVPILFLAVQFLPPAIRIIVQVIGDLTSVGLLALVVFSLAMAWRSRLKEHQDLLSQNISLSERLQAVLNGSASPSESELVTLEAIAGQLETRDRVSLAKIDRAERHRAYREAIKESGPAAVCPVCDSSPWRPKLDDSRECCGNSERSLPGAQEQ